MKAITINFCITFFQGKVGFDCTMIKKQKSGVEFT